MKRLQHLAVGTALVTLVAACQLIVSDELPTYRCIGEDPTSCPAGLVCNPFGVCAPPETVVEAGTDAPADVDAGPTGVGAECVVDGDCNAGLLCGTSTLLTTQVVPQGSKPVCTKPCCTSEECPAGNVCFASGTGSNFCVSALKVGVRASTKSLSGGTTCAASTDCRSGSCVGRCEDAPNKICTSANDCGGSDCVQKQCLDTCCRADDCATGSVCRAQAGTAHAAWACGAPDVLPGGGPSGDVNATCRENSECQSANCAFGFYPDKHCTPSCCTQNDCGALGGGYACGYGKQGTELLKWCFAPTSNAVPLGGACTQDSECATRYCDQEDGTCRSTCCTDADCPSGDGGAPERCLPSPTGAATLRCKK